MPNATVAIHVIASSDVTRMLFVRGCKKVPRYCQAERIPPPRELPAILLNAG
jgi:hypothetical protein